MSYMLIILVSPFILALILYAFISAINDARNWYNRPHKPRKPQLLYPHNVLRVWIFPTEKEKYELLVTKKQSEEKIEKKIEEKKKQDEYWKNKIAEEFWPVRKKWKEWKEVMKDATKLNEIATEALKIKKKYK